MPNTFFEHMDYTLGKHFKYNDEKVRYLRMIGKTQVAGKESPVHQGETRLQVRMTRESAIHHYGPDCLPFWDDETNTNKYY